MRGCTAYKVYTHAKNNDSDDDDEKRFVIERWQRGVLLRLQHPCIVSTWRAGINGDNDICIAMERSQCNANDWISATGYSVLSRVSLAYWFLRDAGQALLHLFAQKMTHSYMSPVNVLWFDHQGLRPGFRLANPANHTGHWFPWAYRPRFAQHTKTGWLGYRAADLWGVGVIALELAGAELVDPDLLRHVTVGSVAVTRLAMRHTLLAKGYAYLVGLIDEALCAPRDDGEKQFEVAKLLARKGKHTRLPAIIVPQDPFTHTNRWNWGDAFAEADKWKGEEATSIESVTADRSLTQCARRMHKW